MDRVGPPDDRHADTAVGSVHRSLVKIVGCLQPVGRRRKVVTVGTTVAADQDGAEVIGPDVFRSDATQVRLNQLADLLLERHARQQFGDSGLVIWL